MFRSLGERTPIKTNERYRQQRLYQSVAGRAGAPLSPVSEREALLGRALNKKKAIRFRFDVPLLLIVFTLIIFGLLMVYSASYDYSYSWYGDPNAIIFRQFLWLGLGLVAMVVVMFIDYHLLEKIAVPAVIGTIVLLVIVLFINEVLNGASRTIYKGSIQPSELAKLVLVLYLSIWLNARREQLGELGFGLFPLAGILGVLGGLIIVQPDLSAVITIFALGGLMFFLAGGEIRQMGLIIIFALVIGALIVQLPGTGKKRIESYLSGIKDPTQGSYHVRRSLEAFASGGWFGVGIGNATAKVTGLPVPPTDSIFAVVGEETGVVGAATLVGLYSLLFFRGLSIAKRAPDFLGSLLAAGLVTWICLEAFINMAVLVNLLPFAGNALPFISAGGSNLVASLTAVGLILNISRLSVRQKEEKGKLFNAVVNLRRWDRRRRVSSSRHPKRPAK